MIPDYTIQALERYKEQHLEPGGFLKALLEGNLELAAHLADRENHLALKEIVHLCETILPTESFGSPEKVRQWLNGMPAHADKMWEDDI